MMPTLKKTLFWTLSLYLTQTVSWAQQPFSVTQDPYETDKNISCLSRMPNQDQRQRAEFIKKFSAYVSRHAFVIPNKNIRQHIRQIEPCFSADGWMEFERAIAQSGNTKIIEARGYEGTGIIEGDITIFHKVGSNVWETDTPITIVYQNQENRVRQRLTVRLKIQERPQGIVEVIQVVGVPRKAITAPPAQ